ncbi:NACHT domain-containing protein [Coleofasciculus sp. FACHB-64]|uniref:NACHT domain-containing protein n=1 Tax=Cyanophyceae TaxID=3028117 RepID=UPI001687180E|nr:MULTISPECIES: NACHT domain-containing protein [unclassified Coleofasciculus]MBD1838624.1 NACHT domain-containing protein [Coleofasciculus sp. FACHB-501]MBD2045859.1 NACHT domain-containing protein [Coleofasciculus sp. FACHB-64]
MTTPDLLRLLLLLLLGLLAVIGGLLPSAFDKQNSLRGKCFIFGLGVLCGVLALIGGGFITTAQAEQNADWIQKVCWTLGFGYVFAVPTTLYLLRSRQGNNAETPSSTPEAISQRRRQELLEIMRTDVTVRRKDSLHDDLLISLLMEDQREEVGRPPEVTVNAKPSPDWWEKLRKFTRVTAKSEPGKKIIDVFGQAGRLLILGAPGSGKTTMLLELAQELILVAQQQPEKPIPVIFELSSWKDDKQPIADWLVADLKFRNNIPETISREWLETGKLLPLLDGLDELKTRQEKCIERINKFLQANSGLSQIVVCCREEEYKTGKEILTLRGAVCLKPLEEKQIQGYLQRLHCGHLWHGIQNDPDGLLALAKMPLFLHLIPVAYPNGLESKAKRFNSPAELEAYQEKCRKDLFDAYIKRRLELPHDCQGYEPEDSKRWLIWLAKNLKEQKQTEFIIEETQQNFLDNHKQKLVSVLLIVGLFSVFRLEMISILISLLVVYLLDNYIDINVLDQKLIFWLFEKDAKNQTKSNKKTKNLFITSVIFILITLPFVMLIEAVLLLAKRQFVEPINLVIHGIGIVLTWSIFSAGLPVIQHFVSRLILWKSGAIPWNYARFLSYANERRLIKQVGGRYRFIHDLLREHFAKM